MKLVINDRYLLRYERFSNDGKLPTFNGSKEFKFSVVKVECEVIDASNLFQKNIFKA